MAQFGPRGLAGQRQSRLEALEALLADCQLDALLLTTPSSVHYVSGFLVSLHTRPVAVLVARGEAPVLIIPAIERPIADALLWPGEVLDYGDNGFAETLITVSSRLRVRSIGIEADMFPVSLDRIIRRRQAELDFIDVTESLDRIWWVKDAAEVEAMRQAGLLCCQALDQAQTAFDGGEAELVGKAEGDRAALLTAVRRDPAARVQIFSNVVSGVRTRAGGGHDLATGRRPQSGDLIFFVWAVCWNGYWALISRTGEVGSVPPVIKSLHQRVRDAKRAVLEVLRPGTPLAAVFTRAFDAIRPEASWIVSVGRGIGARMGESPVIAPGNATPLQPGMVLRLGPEVFGPFGAIGMIDTIAITQDGYDILTRP